jgi:hypothetical protein
MVKEAVLSTCDPARRPNRAVSRAPRESLAAITAVVCTHALLDAAGVLLTAPT